MYNEFFPFHSGWGHGHDHGYGHGGGGIVNNLVVSVNEPYGEDVAIEALDEAEGLEAVGLVDRVARVGHVVKDTTTHVVKDTMNHVYK